jgi:hypothetical protein
VLSNFLSSISCFSPLLWVCRQLWLAIALGAWLDLAHSAPDRNNAKNNPKLRQHLPPHTKAATTAVAATAVQQKLLLSQQTNPSM